MITGASTVKRSATKGKISYNENAANRKLCGSDGFARSVPGADGGTGAARQLTCQNIGGAGAGGRAETLSRPRGRAGQAGKRRGRLAVQRAGPLRQNAARGHGRRPYRQDCNGGGYLEGRRAARSPGRCRQSAS